MVDLHALHRDEGHSIWVDDLSRSMLQTGRLDALIADGVRGLTSNPAIFATAMAGGDEYADQFRGLVSSGHSVEEAYWDMVIDDITAACDRFAALYETSYATDGFVSVEVDPRLAHDTAATIAAGRDLAARIARPNVMIKVPATPAGLPAITALIGDGINVNVTLIFSLQRYSEVMEAHIAGLEMAARAGGDLSRIAGVASFFISRVDTEVDARLGPSHPLRGTAALAQGRLAFAAFTSTFDGPRWESLAAAGARAQRPLWASTGTKDPAYSDVVYVDGLIGPTSVNTLPPATLAAFTDHGTARRTIDANPEDTARTWTELADAGIDMSEVAGLLADRGVSAFVDSFDGILATLHDAAPGSDR